jgi:hypothetical protein
MQVGDIVTIERDDHGGQRIPMEYRNYIVENKTYTYKARIVRILGNKSYNLVQPLPPFGDTVGVKEITRKGYKRKICGWVA